MGVGEDEFLEVLEQYCCTRENVAAETKMMASFTKWWESPQLNFDSFTYEATQESFLDVFCSSSYTGRLPGFIACMMPIASTAIVRITSRSTMYFMPSVFHHSCRVGEE